MSDKEENVKLALEAHTNLMIMELNEWEKKLDIMELASISRPEKVKDKDFFARQWQRIADKMEILAKKYHQLAETTKSGGK